MADNEDVLTALAVGLLGLGAYVAWIKRNVPPVASPLLPPPAFIGPAPVERPPVPGRKPVNDAAAIGFNAIYQKWGILRGIDWKLLKAIAIVESNENSQAKNPADPSYGLMQVLCVNTGPNSRCTNRFNIQGWDRATPERLFNPDFNVDMASQILKWNIQNYGIQKGVAVYNRWESRKDPVNGPFGNQGYVDKVFAAYRAIGGNAPV